MSNWISGVLVVALLIGGIVMGFLDTEGGVGNGVQAPAFAFVKFTGERITSEELKGKVVMLDFWATWCPPCVEEMPMLVKVAQEYKSKGVVFIAVNRDDPEDAEEDVTAFINHKVPGLRPFAAYGDAVSGAVFKVRALPTIYIVDPSGKIIASQTGQVSERRVRAWLDKALQAR